jgi:hypothetical protein
MRSPHLEVTSALQHSTRFAKFPFCAGELLPMPVDAELHADTRLQASWDRHRYESLCALLLSSIACFESRAYVSLHMPVSFPHL